jgi:hypothetical protein
MRMAAGGMIPIHTRRYAKAPWSPTAVPAFMFAIEIPRLTVLLISYLRELG